VAAPNPKLIYVSIAPYGQDGPKAGWAESDLVVLAAGGALALIGDDDRAPVRVSVPQAYLHAGAEAAVGAMIALFGRGGTGRGQHVDVSAQLAVNQTTFSSSLAAATSFPPPRRLSGGVRYGRTPLQQVYPTKDGYVAITLLFGNAIGPYTKKLFDYIHEEGFCDEAMCDNDWITYGDGLLTGKISDEEFDRVKQTVRDFTQTRTKADLFRTAQERGLLIAPITKIDEVLASEQLVTRDYWVELEHSETGASFQYPGPFAKFGDAPIEYRRRAPAIGEHNREVFVDELGLSEDELLKLQRNGVV
jgi:benzylsuccinate CoA-transferase BbsE subunit